jgi:ATP-dependent Clp protease ATP-binding subunit ClpB
MINTEIEELKIKQQRYQLDGEYAKASEILYQKIPALQQKLTTKNKLLKESGNSLIRDTVNQDEIAEIISK